MSTFSYGLRQGIKNIIQNKMFSIAAIGTISTCLFLLSLFYTILTNFQNIIYNAEGNVGVTVFFDDGTEPARIDEIAEQIRAIEGVERVDYISPEQAWETFKKDIYSDDDSVAQTFGDDNPLQDSASLVVYAKNVSYQTKLVEDIGDIDDVRKINSSNAVAKSLTNINRLVTYVSVTIISLLFIVSIFLIHTAVATGIKVRSKEISIMKMIGATESFIRIPFIVEGLFLGLLGSFPPIVITWIVYEKMTGFLPRHFTALAKWLTFIDVGTEFKVIIPMSIGIGLGIGFLGSFISVRKCAAV